MGSFWSEVAGFWMVLFGGVCIGKDRYERDGPGFPWLTLVGVALAVAGGIFLKRSNALAVAEARARSGVAGGEAGNRGGENSRAG